MPTRTALSKATPVVVAEEADDLMTPGLQFNEPLSWRAGKPIPIADLLRRLQILFKEMRGMDQEENERDSFTKVAKELASPNLLSHKDKGVKAWTACCLVEILRLCAPDAPYTGQQLKDIFTMLIRMVLPALSDPSNAYNNQHLHVLESLAQVKSIVLLTDIPSSEELTQHLFTSFFDILSGSSKASTGEQLGKNVELHMTSILGIMVDESAALSTEVIDVIVAQFLRTDPRASSGGPGKSKKNGVQPAFEGKQTKLVFKDLPPAYNMAKTICNTCPEKMARHISQYFNDVIMDAASSSSAKQGNKNRSHRRSSDNMDDSDDEPNGPTEEDLKELHKAHQLLRELWRASPAVLQNVIPQLEAELSAENVQLRLIATETLGDIISGIGSAGPPPPPTMDAAAYPTLNLSNPVDPKISQNLSTKPSSLMSFPQAHPQAYSSFLRRKKDKSPLIRVAWTTEIGRILTTSAGGVGLSQSEERTLVEDLAHMMVDADEKVRVAAIKVVGNFSLKDVIDKLGSSGGVTTSDSVLGTLGDRVRDKKHTVHVEAMRVLSCIWGVAAGEIAAGEEKVIACIGAVPSRILDAYYANDMDINASLDHAIFEQLLPMNFPPVKLKATKNVNGNSQLVRDSQTNGEIEAESLDPDKIRTERILILVKNLDERAKKVFYAIQSRQLVLAKIMTAYLQRCEDFNAGTMDDNEKQIKDHLTRLIDEFGKLLPDPVKTKADLWKFARLHDRRAYQLIRFCMGPESDFRTVLRAMKEFTKRIEGSAPAVLDTLTPLLYRVGVIIYNKSHVPAIMEYSKSDEKSLAATAHEVLREISSRTPEVLKAHVQEICRTLEEEAPTLKQGNGLGAVDDLKACALFAPKFAKEIPRDRKFVQAMTNFALMGTPPEAAKHAITIIMTTSDKKQMLAKDLVRKCVKDFQFGTAGFLSRLATLSQLMLLAPNEVDEESDTIIDIAIERVLLKVRTTSTEASTLLGWSDNMDEECEAKCWALKILVNRIRSHPTLETLSDHATPVYKLLSTLLTKEGEVANEKNTPDAHKSRLRLLAARLYLKLCTKKPHDALLTPLGFNNLALVAQDGQLPVRRGFMQRLKKYLGQQRLPQRFYTIPFLIAFEPNDELRSETTTWIRSRATFFSNLKSQSSSLPNSGKAAIVMESVFARLISLLAHHPDYGDNPEDLIDFSRFLILYLQNVATEENISLIYHIAQRVKQCRDAVVPRASVGEPSPFDNILYHLSDLAQLTIHRFEDAHSWNIQTLPAKIRLPTSLFAELTSHDEAQQIAERNYLPEDVEASVEALVRASLRSGRGRKRKSEGADVHGEGREHKKVKGLPIGKAETGAAKEKKPHAKASGTPAVVKTPKKKQSTHGGSGKAKAEKGEASSERRRSDRVKSTEEKSYIERDDDEDDEEMEVLSWEYINEQPRVEEEEEDGRELDGVEEDDGDIEAHEEDEEVVEQDSDDMQEAPTESLAQRPEPAKGRLKGRKTPTPRKPAEAAKPITSSATKAKAKQKPATRTPPMVTATAAATRNMRAGVGAKGRGAVVIAEEKTQEIREKDEDDEDISDPLSEEED